MAYCCSSNDVLGVVGAAVTLSSFYRFLQTEFDACKPASTEYVLANVKNAIYLYVKISNACLLLALSSPHESAISQIPLIASRHARRASVSRRACSNTADDEEAAVLACACTSIVFCVLNLHQSQKQLLEKVR